MGDLIPVSDDSSAGAHSDEGIAANFLPTDHTFEESCGIFARIEQPEGANWGQVIAQESAINGYDFELLVVVEVLIEIWKSVHSGSNWSRVLGFVGR